MAVQWQEGTIQAITGTGWATLAADTAEAASAWEADVTPEYTLADISIQATTSGTSFAEGNVWVDVYLIRRISATAGDDQLTDESGPSPTNEPLAYVGSLTHPGAAALSTRGVIPKVDLPSGDFKIMLHNRHTAAWTAATVRLLPYRLQDVA